MEVSVTTIILAGMGPVCGCATNDEGHVLSTATNDYSVVSGNRLTFDRLTFNSLEGDRMENSRLSVDSFNGLEATAEGRELLVYVICCALAQSDVVSVQYEDVVYEFSGLLNLTPEWVQRGLNENEQRKMTGVYSPM
jgi:hypothetical protein